MVLNTNKGIMKAHGVFGSVPKCRFLLNVTSGLSTKIASMWKKVYYAGSVYCNVY